MKKWCWLLCFMFILPCFAFCGCDIFYQTAICKIGNQEYSSLGDAIVASKEGDVIDIYNDCLKNNAQLSFTSTNLNGVDYVQYIINKSITLNGIAQNYKKPKVFGSIITNLPDENKTITIKNIELINDYMSTETDSKNTPFLSAVRVLDGNITVQNCNIHTSNTIENSIIEQNGLSLLNGISITRNTDNKNYHYIVRDNEIYNYQNYTQEKSACAFCIQTENNKSMLPYKINYDDSDFLTVLTTQNKILNNQTNVKICNDDKEVYNFLSTYQKSFIKDSNFIEGSIVEFLGDVFGYDTLQTFNVFGQMKFNAVKNIHFVIKTATGKVERNISKDENIKVTPYNQNANI